MNLDQSLLFSMDKDSETCQSARIRMTLDKGPMTRSIKAIAESPRRDFRVSKLVQHKTGARLNRYIPEKAQELESTRLKELIFLLKQYGRAEGAIEAYALNLARTQSEEIALSQIGKLIYLLDKNELSELPLDPDKTIPQLFETSINKTVARIVGSPDTPLFRISAARKIAKALVTTKGLINFGLIPRLSEALPRHFSASSDHLKSLLQNLDTLYKESAVRDKLSSIPSPTEANEAGRAIICVSLQLEPEKEIKSYHAQRAALMALLCRPRQEHVANCFALSIAISLFSSSINACLDDFREILEYGYMKRLVQGKSVYFPALLRQPLTSLSDPLELENEKPRVDRLLKHLKQPMPTNLPENPTVEDFLGRLDPKVYDQAAFIWESDTKNALVTVWSNILASMAEAKDNGLIKTAIVASAYFATQQNKVSEKELELLKARLLQRIYLHYDPSVPPFSKGEEAGAFVLYDKKDYSRIDTPEKYTRFLASLAISEKMRKQFLKEETLKQILSVYEQEGSRLHLSGARLSRLRHTPWITRIGNSPTALMRTYINISQEDISETFNPTSVENLLESVIGSAKKELDRVSNTRRGHLSTHIPMRIVGEHAFNLIMTHPSFMRCVVGDVKEILEEMEAKCHRMPVLPLPQETRENMEAYILSKAAHLKAFLEATPPDSTLASYRDYLTKKLSHETVDRKLFQFLPEEIKKELEELAIHFADTNWQINGSDIHLAIVYSLFTQKLELFHAEGSGKLLYPVNMKEQLAGKTWEIFFNPQATL